MEGQDFSKKKYSFGFSIIMSHLIWLNFILNVKVKFYLVSLYYCDIPTPCGGSTGFFPLSEGQSGVQ